MIIKDNVYIVTGASSGIGEQISKTLAEKGAHVVCAARRKEELNVVCQKIKSNGGSAIPVQTDITDLDQCHKLVQIELCLKIIYP